MSKKDPFFELRALIVMCVCSFGCIGISYLFLQSLEDINYLFAAIGLMAVCIFILWLAKKL